MGPDGSPGRPKPLQHGKLRATGNLRRRGSVQERGYDARSTVGHSVGNVGQDGCLKGSDCSDAGSLDKVAARKGGP